MCLLIFVFSSISATLVRPDPFLAVPIPQGGSGSSSLVVDERNVTITIPEVYGGFCAIVVLEYLKNR